MYTLIGLRDGRMMEALVLAKGRSRMRLATAGLKDTVELRLCGSEWLDEDEDPVEFSFLMAADEGASEAPKLVRAAGGRAG